MEKSELKNESVKLFFDLAEVIRTGKAWTRVGSSVRITEVKVGSDDVYALQGVHLVAGILCRDTWTLDGRYNLKYDSCRLDLTTLKS